MAAFNMPTDHHSDIKKEPTLMLTCHNGRIDDYIIPMRRVLAQSSQSGKLYSSVSRLHDFLNNQEAYAGVVDLPIEAFNRITVQQLASFLAEGCYEIGAEDSELNALQQHIHVYAVASYYDVPRLSDLALDGLKKELDSRWSAEALIAALKEIQDLFPNLRTFYSKTLAQSASEHVEELMQYTGFFNPMDHREFLTHLKQICQTQLGREWSVHEFSSVLRAMDTLFLEREPEQYEMLALIASEHIDELLRCTSFTSFRLADSFLTSLRITCETKLRSNWSVQEFISALMAAETLFPGPESTKYETLAWIASEHINELQACTSFTSLRLPAPFLHSLKMRCEIRLKSNWTASEFISILKVFTTVLPELQRTDYEVLATMASDNIDELMSTEFEHLRLPAGFLMLVIDKTKSKHEELFEAAKRAKKLINMFLLMAWHSTGMQRQWQSIFDLI